MTEEFKKIIDEDIAACETELKSGNLKNKFALHARLISKYGTIIDGFKDDLRSLFYDDDGIYATENIETMRQKLLLFKAMEYKNVYAESDNSITVNNSNQVINTVNLTFADAKEKIENMSALSETDISEILEKIKNIEEIVTSKEKKTKKWEKAKPIITWVADKGVDVALTLIPLLLKIGEQ